MNRSRGPIHSHTESECMDKETKKRKRQQDTMEDKQKKIKRFITETQVQIRFSKNRRREK